MECDLNVQCYLAADEGTCCAECPQRPSAVRAVLVSVLSDAEECRNTGACDACLAEGPQSVVLPACVEGRCTAVDVRALDATACEADSDCELVQTVCCPACIDPSFTVAMRKGASLPGAPQCDGVTCPAAAPNCTLDRWIPTVFCAPDKHCTATWQRE